MDAIRRQQLDEILDYDRNMNLKVLALQRKQVALMGPEGGEIGGEEGEGDWGRVLATNHARVARQLCSE